MPAGVAGSAAAVPGSESGGDVGVGLGTFVGVEIAGDGVRTAGVERGTRTVVVPLHPTSDKPMMAIRTRVRKEGLRMVVLSESWYARSVPKAGKSSRQLGWTGHGSTVPIRRQSLPLQLGWRHSTDLDTDTSRCCPGSIVRTNGYPREFPQLLG
jgi:hypothetical protein